MADKDRTKDVHTVVNGKRSGEESSTLTHRMEVNDANEGQSFGTVSTPDGDNAAENRVSTSISDD
jgi:hypothetical protein